MKKSILYLLASLALIASASFTAQAQQEINATLEERIAIQVGLAAEGFNPGEIDGIFGDQTQTAIRDWQTAEGLSVTGSLTDMQANRLAEGWGWRGVRILTEELMDKTITELRQQMDQQGNQINQLTQRVEYLTGLLEGLRENQ